MNKQLPLLGSTVEPRYEGLDTPMRVAVRTILALIREQDRRVIDAVNFNSVQKVSQDAQPTPSANRMVVWEDTDAAGGQPTHYIVVNFGGTVVTFASEETA